MPELPTSLPRLGPPVRGITPRDVELAADALLRAGERPTIEKIRERIGRGSPNTINPILDAWWKRLASRLDAGPAALHRLPEAVAHVAEALWMQALDEARRRAEQELSREARSALSAKQDLEVRSHVITLREGELERRLHEKDRTLDDLRTQVQALNLNARKDKATIEAQATRLTALENQLLASSSSSRAVRAGSRQLPRSRPLVGDRELPEPQNFRARRRRVRRASPTRLPESRSKSLDSVAASVPQGTTARPRPKRKAQRSIEPKALRKPKRAAKLPRSLPTKARKPQAHKKAPTRKRRR